MCVFWTIAIGDFLIIAQYALTCSQSIALTAKKLLTVVSEPTERITMSTNFPNSLDNFPNPSSTTNLDSSGSGNSSLRHSTQHQNANDAIEALEAKLGINFSSSTISIDFIVNLLLMTTGEHNQGVVRVITGGPFPTAITWFKDLSKTIKLVEKEYSYDLRHNINQVTVRLYDGTVANTVKRTIVDTKTLSGPFEIERVRTVS